MFCDFSDKDYIHFGRGFSFMGINVLFAEYSFPYSRGLKGEASGCLLELSIKLKKHPKKLRFFTKKYGLPIDY